MRRWIPAVACAAAVALAAGVLGRWDAAGGHRGLAAAPSGAASRPCGGEALAEDAFPPLGLLATGPSTARPAPGGTPDAPGAPDGRPEVFLPDGPAFAALLDREGAQVQMSVFRTNFSHASPSQAANIALVARKLTGLVIAPGASLSYNRTVGPYTEAGGFGWGRMFVGNRIVPTIGGGVCQGASTLYNAVLLADLSVIERHVHGLTVPYLDPGRDATVTESGGLDLRFRNSTAAPIVLWAQAQDRWLTVAIYGRERPPTVEVHTQVLSRQAFATIVVPDPHLAPGTEQVAAAGQDGVRARAWVVVHQPRGPQRRDLGEHTYRPSPRILLRGPAAPPGPSSAAATST